jgi:hypothetical protein
MATALSGHIDDRDGTPTRLEGFSPPRPYFPPDQPGFWPVVEQVTKGPSPVRTRRHLPPGSAGRRRVRHRRRPRDNPAEPGHTFADHERTLPPQPRPRDSPRPADRGHQPPPAKATGFFTAPARPKSATRPTSPRDHPGPASPAHQLERPEPRDERAGRGRTGWRPTSGRRRWRPRKRHSALTQVSPTVRTPRNTSIPGSTGRPWTVVTACVMWRRPASRPQSLPRTKPRDRKDPDRTRTNRAARKRCTTSRRRTCWLPELS